MGSVNVAEWVSIVTCAGQVSLAVLALRRGSGSALAPPLAGLCAVLFGWNFATLAHTLSGLAMWRVIDVTVSAFTMPTALHFVLAFVGERRRYSRVLWLSYAALGALSLSTASGLFFEGGRWLAQSSDWALIHILLALAGVAFALWRLVVHLRSTDVPQERARTSLVLTAVAVGGAFSTTELLADLSVPIMRLGNVGTLGSAALLTVVTLRFRLFERDIGLAAALQALAVGAVAVLGYLMVFRFLASSTAMLVLGTGALTVVAGITIRALTSQYAAAREQTDRLALLGRLSAQMAHDLKNPLAALRGAVQLLEGDAAAGRAPTDRSEMLGLMRAQIDRLTSVIDKYRRLGAVEPALAPVAVNDTVRAVMGLAAFASMEAKLESDLGEPLPLVRADSDLLAAVVENLVRNAVEATPAGGRVTVHTRETTTGPRGVEIEVDDTGAGMSTRVLERAVDDFFTTKAQGTGLGLGFVRRVADAHHGRLSIVSHEGAGTRVTFWLPLA